MLNQLRQTPLKRDAYFQTMIDYWLHCIDLLKDKQYLPKEMVDAIRARILHFESTEAREDAIAEMEECFSGCIEEITEKFSDIDVKLQAAEAWRETEQVNQLQVMVYFKDIPKDQLHSAHLQYEAGLRATFRVQPEVNEKILKAIKPSFMEESGKWVEERGAA